MTVIFRLYKTFEENAFFTFLFSFPSISFLISSFETGAHHKAQPSHELTMILLPQPLGCWSTTPNGHFPSPTLALEVCSFRGSPHITHLSHVFVAVIKCYDQEQTVEEQVCFGFRLQLLGLRGPNGRGSMNVVARVGSWLVTFHLHKKQSPPPSDICPPVRLLLKTP